MDPAPAQVPVIRTPQPDPEPVRALDKDPLDIPDLPPPPGKPPRGQVPRPPVEPAVAVQSPEPEDAEGGGPAARQEPAVSLEWFGPTTLKVGAPAEYTVVARNMSPIPLHKVIVQVKVPTGARVAGTEPKAQGTEAVLMWDLGTLAPRQEMPVKVRLVPPAHGEMTLPGLGDVHRVGARSRSRSREPKLQVAVRAPEKATVGDPVPVVLTVRNPGDHPADGVKVARSPSGRAGGRPRKPGSSTSARWRPAKPGRCTVSCVARAAGTHKCDVTAEGDGRADGPSGPRAWRSSSRSSTWK